MKFLVLGSSGMAGHVIALYLKERGHDVTGFSRRPVSYVKSIRGDAADTELLVRTITQNSFDVIINAIGILNRDAEIRKADAVFLNAFLPHFLAKVTVSLKTRVFHMSTDCVFKGNTGPYAEDSIPDGESFYDRSKALGELSDSKNLTVRCSIVGPDIHENGIGLFNWFMKQRGTVRGYTQAMWTGLTTVELARAMLVAAETGATGLVNFVPNKNISKYDLLRLFNSVFRKNTLNIVPDERVNLDKTLIRTNFSCPFLSKNYEDQIRDMYAWVIDHEYLYPNYKEALNE